MEFGKAISFIFDDEEWIKKILIMTVISLIPLVGQFVVIGWSFEIAKRVKNNDPMPLAELDFGEQLRKGFMIFLGYLLYFIPAFIFICLGAAAQAGILAIDEDMAAVGSIIYGCFGCLAFIYGIFAAMLIAAAMVRYMDSEEFSAFTAVGETWSLLRENFGDFGMFFLFALLLSIIAGFVSGLLIICLVGLAVTAMMYASLGHLLGQLAAKLDNASPAV